MVADCKAIGSATWKLKSKRGGHNKNRTGSR